jgi:NAD(P)-dependent dehydrogenase (short-subunit alcohol dehydrogenase family)
MSLFSRFLLAPFFKINSGIGYALAKEFLKAGDNVIICSRTGNELLGVPLLNSPHHII